MVLPTYKLAKYSSTRRNAERSGRCPAAYVLALLLAGCNNHEHLIVKTADGNGSVQYPTRPTAPPAPFKLFHQTDNSLTLVTADNATDEQIESLIWQLHDAARDRSFDKLHLPQKFIDKRDPIVFIHIYRGTKCAAEKYAAGNPPCGGSYHAAGDYTLGSFKDPNRDDGVLLHDENHQVELWNPDATSAAKAAQK
jgi:hypothetical protein